ncbi:phosphinothricin acetyltransferase [Dehalogenimonas formicexedens]|uniref:Phosphinothricin acetyltransferase n=1 Tax=Dehalogenimonas formicexedens TaxID=1839801 RepID=A0A1P8F8L3_9CHLR|nr:GNAT family N-acetyltransferase [Dehalogenimonas formicexedens]APV44807.1 phosphinothricin acetyltransferase [Dehalogenimonas formicexedens]
MNRDVSIRLAKTDDLQAINEIYNHYVLASTCTYQEKTETIEARKKWFEHHAPETYPVVVAEQAGAVVGWGSLSPYHTRYAYRFTVENSVYIHHEYLRQGIGTAILKDLIDRARKIGYHAIIAAIDGSQASSIDLHRKFGFTEVGHFHEVGFKFGTWLDVVYLEFMPGGQP